MVEVVEVEGEVLHVLGEGQAPEAGSRVACAVDWTRRFDHMQQHHGQHLLSAAFLRLQGAAPSPSTSERRPAPSISTSRRRDFRPEELAAAEAEANRLVWSDLPVDARERTPEELAALPLRKDATKGARIVAVGGAGAVVDASPCGGTHPRRTGEVGAIAVLRAQKWGAGTRVEFACGGRVLGLLHQAEERLSRASAALRCAPPELVLAVGKLAEEGQARRKELTLLLEALAAVEAERLAGTHPAGAPLSVRLDGALGSPAGLKAVAQSLAARGRVALVGGVDGGRAHLCFARARGPGVHLGELLRESAALLGGKGGGAPELAQGSGPDGARLDEALAAAAARLGGG